MIRTRSLNATDAGLIAISALDDLVAELVCGQKFSLPAPFLDWVGDEATALVHGRVTGWFNEPAFSASLQAGDPRIALRRWVRHWICPRIAARFAVLAEQMHEWAEASPAEGLSQPEAAAQPTGHAATPPLSARPAWTLLPAHGGRVQAA
ncbi:MAG: hypothetical protein JWQ72_1635 [Polaromonas sp.]|nr:hypothetical protein [Polaromonas sp.]